MLKVVVFKELRRVFTDRRLVISTFILPAVSIFLIYSLMGNMMGNMFNDRDEHTSTIYVYNAPESFKLYSGTLNDASIEMNFEENEFDSRIAGLREGDVDLVIEFVEAFDDQVLNYETVEVLPEIKTFYNPSEDYSSPARSKFVYEILEGYEQELLVNRFGNSNFANAFAVDSTNEESEVLDESKAAGIGLSMLLPMLIAMLLFAGAMGIGIDTIAGEKERGTMATLLLTPVSRETIALGKMIGLAVVAIISALCSFIAIIASLPNAGGVISGGADISLSSLSFSTMQYIQLLVIMLTLVGVYVGLICITSVRARTVKEAGTYVSPIYMLVMFAAFSTIFTTGTPPLYQFAIPILGNVLAIKRIFLFELGMNEFLITSAVSLIVTAILTYFITKSFKDEKVMLNA